MPLQVIRDSIYKVETLCKVHPTYQSYFDDYEVRIKNRFIGHIYHDIDIDKPLVNLTEAVLEIHEDGTYIMHVVGPRYVASNLQLSMALLKASYTNCLQLALKEGISDIAFPLISAGGKGFPKALAFEIAKETMDAFLIKYPLINITLVVYEDDMYEVAKQYIDKVETYLLDTYQEPLERMAYMKDSLLSEDELEDDVDEEEDVEQSHHANIHNQKIEHSYTRKKSLNLKHMHQIEVSETFARHLSIWLERRQIRDSTLYKSIAMSKQTFNKIINGKTERPNQKTVMLLAIGLQLNIDETLDFMGVVGYTFSTSSKFDLIVRYFIEEKNYQLSHIESTLFEFTGDTLINYH